jgi:hypothetical protein
MQELQQRFLVGIKLLKGLAFDAGNERCNQPSDDDIAVLYELLTEARAWRPKLQCRLDPSQQRTRQLPARHPAPEAGLSSIK